MKLLNSGLQLLENIANLLINDKRALAPTHDGWNVTPRCAADHEKSWDFI